MKSKANIHAIRKLAATVHDVPGDVAEFGVYQGGSARELCELFPLRRVYLFDSCEGLPKDRGPLDGDKPGAFAATELEIRETLDGHHNYTLLPGWFADTMSLVGNVGLCFAHIDCDYEQSYRDCVPWVLDRLLPGGVVVFDDYGCQQCKGATAYLDSLLGGDVVKHAGQGAHYRKPANA